MDSTKKRSIISLDSDDDVELEQHLRKQQTIEHSSAVVEILSDDTENSDDEVIKLPNDLKDEPVKNLNQEISVPDALTPQQEMRKRLADAAEKRLNKQKEGLPSSSIYNVDTNDGIEILKPSFVKTEKKTIIKPSSIDDRSSRIRLIANPTYCSEFGISADKDTVSLSDMVGSKDLVKTYQFNMLIDFDYLTQFVTSKDCEFILINKSDEDYLHIKDESWEKYRVHTVDVSTKLPKYGTHHSKMMVNFFRDGSCQVIIHTMNMTQADHVIQTQMCWMSPQLKLHSDKSKWLDCADPNITYESDTGTVFKRDFIAYLTSYQNNDIDKLVDVLGRYDFSPIDVIFISSTPGHFQYSDWNKLIEPNAKPLFGYGRLWQVIHLLKLQSLMGSFVGQVSTIAGPCDNWKRNTFVHVLTSCVEKGYPMIKKADYVYKNGKNKIEPVIIWPTVSEILKSKSAPLSGIALHLTSKGKWAAFARQFDEIKRYFHKWSGINDPNLSKAGRSNLAPHVKTYTVTEDNFKTLKWILLTSANISHQAWGKPKSYNVIEYDICSFEAGIFIDPKLLKVDSNVDNKRQVLVPTYGKDSPDNEESLSGNIFKIGIRLPYDTPLQSYSSTDVAWSQPDSEKYFI